jgi:SAM-dependent methyltransferase
MLVLDSLNCLDNLSASFHPTMNIETPLEVVTDELALLSTLVPVEGTAALDLGCGKGDFARILITRGRAKFVDALEVDVRQHRLNTEGPQLPGLTFGQGGAERIPMPDDSRDLVVMMKSLHHVPLALLDSVPSEIRRVLKPGGHFYVSEPVYAGEFNDIVKTFHDEGEVRAAAWAALQRAIAAGVFERVQERVFLAPLVFRDFDDFMERIVRATHSEHVMTDELVSTVRSRFESFMTPTGARFVRPMRLCLLRKPT